MFAGANDATLAHLRTHRGEHEIDFILKHPAGGVVAVEVKLANTINDTDVRHLTWLKSLIGEQLLDAVVVSTGPFAYRRRDGIAVVPLGLLASRVG